jgi:hypothetical protein
MSKMNEARLRQSLEMLSRVQPSPEATGRAIGRVRQTLLNDERLRARQSLWTAVMESRWSRWAAAAAVIVAVALGLNVIGDRHLGGIAWSQVLRNVRQSRSCIHQALFTIGQEGRPDATYEFVMVRSSEYGLRRDAYREGRLVSRLYIPRDAKNCVEILPVQKKYAKVVLTEPQLAEIRERDPSRLVEFLMSFQYRGLPPKEVDGKVRAGIEVNDPRFGKNLFEEGKGRLWADAATDLPVLMEFEGTSSGGAIRTRITMDRFQWDPVVTEADFEPNIPADYTLMAEVNLSPDDGTLIKALRNFARITGGKYPSSLDVMTAMNEVQRAFMIERRNRGVSVEQQPTKEELDGLLAIQGASTRYGELMNQDKDVAYHGGKVTTEFPHTVLMRWRLDDGQYRVIFGDLTVQDVPAERLKVLEAMPLNADRRAIHPVPADGSQGLGISGLQLRWLPGTAAAAHQLYFGTDPNHLPLLATVTEASFRDLPTLEWNATYFWRVDEVDAAGSVLAGNLWSFSTGRLVGWWKLDEMKGNVTADSAGNHAGTLLGNPTWTQGIAGGALQFDGQGDGVDLAAGPDFDITGRITVAAWIKVAAFDVAWQAIVSKGDTAWRLSRDQGNNVHFACTGLWPEWARGSANVNDGQWHHVAGTYDGSELRLYVDGKLDASAKTQGTINVNAYPVYIGENSEHPGRAWHGLIDDVRLYNYALSDAEIKALGNAKP